MKWNKSKTPKAQAKRAMIRDNNLKLSKPEPKEEEQARVRPKQKKSKKLSHPSNDKSAATWYPNRMRRKEKTKLEDGTGDWLAFKP